MILHDISQKDQYTDNRDGDALISPLIGRIADSRQAGEVLVEFNGSQPRAARLLFGLNRVELSKPESKGREVLIVFEQGDPDRPIIVGLMENPLEDMLFREPDFPHPCKTSEQPSEALIDGRRVTIEAQEEIVLKCGSGSITLRKDGKIVIKGTHLLSRSSGPVRVKGGSVNIN